LAERNFQPDGDVDLFGDPVTGRERGQGRPAHERTRETVNRVILGLARGWDKKTVARSIGITVPTLHKHYFRELDFAADAAVMMESVQLGRLNDQAEKGNIAAEKELLKALAKGRTQAAEQRIVDRAAGKGAKLGKKERLKQAAEEQSKAGNKFAPPDAPSLLNPAGNA
jgi:hypothetical protein